MPAVRLALVQLSPRLAFPSTFKTRGFPHYVSIMKNSSPTAAADDDDEGDHYDDVDDVRQPKRLLNQASWSALAQYLDPAQGAEAGKASSAYAQAGCNGGSYLKLVSPARV